MQHADETVSVRDSKQHDGPVLAFGSEAWSAFIREIKDGEFDGVESR